MHSSESMGDIHNAPSYEAQFSQQRRAEMLARASVDRYNRPVVYYRYMKRGAFERLLEQGEITSAERFRDPDEPFDEQILADALLALMPYDKAVERHEPKAGLRDAIESVGRTDPVFAQALGELAASERFTPRSVHPLLDAYMNRRSLMRMHASSRYLRLSPFLSLSAGCVINDAVWEDYVYVEFVIPDIEVEPNPDAFKGEMEVVARRLNAAWITRVYTTTEQLRGEITTNPLTPVGKYHGTAEADMTPPVDLWRWHEPIEDYLPLSLIEVTRERERSLFNRLPSV